MSAGDTLDEGRLELENVSSKESGSPSAGYQRLVPYLTPYELSVKSVIERSSGRRYHLKSALVGFFLAYLRLSVGTMVHVSILISPYVEEIIEGLKILFETEEDEGTYPGYPRTVALCTEVNETRQMSIATSKDVWPPRSFLQSWVIHARESRFGARGS